MRKPICITALAAVYALLAAGACKKSDEARPAGDTVAPAEPAPAAAPAAAGDVGTLTAGQREWEALLDTIRANVDRDTAATARALRSAAASVRREAAEANENARTALTRSADELDSLGASIARGTKRTAASLDSAFARLEYSEALSRLANATDAWAKQQHTRASEELQAAANNFDRAANDAKVKLDAAATKAADDARDIAERLRTGAEVTDAEFRKAAAELEKQVRRVGARITRTS
jgi:vacuolar-type H+-ATPase catalytic subunit A/Vma1